MSGFSFSLTNPFKNRDTAIPPKIKIHHEEPLLIPQLGQTLQHHLSILDALGERTIIIVCIGTDRSTGDSLGPIVGTRLLENKEIACSVYGSLCNPVHATNLEETLAKIEVEYENPLIIAIDASLGRSESVGAITLAAGPLKPGAGVNKKLPQVGDLHFTGIVNVGGYMEYLVLQNTRLGLVWKMANTIAASIEHGLALIGQHQQPRKREPMGTLQ